MQSAGRQGGHRSGAGAALALAALPGFIAGTALQLQQPALWDWPIYACFGLLAPVLYWVDATKHIAIRGRSWRYGAAFVAVAMLAFALCGLRALAFDRDALPPALEGQGDRKSTRLNSSHHSISYAV